MGTHLPLPQRGTAPNFRPISVVAKWLDGLRCHLVWTSQKGGGAPQFSAHVYCGQTVGWIKMLFGMEVGLSPGHIVLDGDPAGPLPKKGRSPPIFGPRLLWPNGCMDQDAIWYAGRPRFMRYCARWEPSSPCRKGAQPPIFGQCPLWPNGWMD